MKKNKIDISGKSPAIFIKDLIPTIDYRDFKKLINYKKNIRYCLHKSRKNKLQCMVNLIRKNSDIKMHKHNREEVYCILKGKISISLKINKKIKKIIMNNKKNQILFMPKNILHSIKSDTNYCIFLEISSGPFSKKNNFYEKN